MRLLLLVFFLIVLLSCKKSNDAAALANEYTLSWLALGDSYTIGQGVESSDRFPDQAVGLLKQRKIRVNNLTYVARTGWTSADLYGSILDMKDSAYSIVTLLIGVNDQFQGVDTSNYKKNFESILTQAIRFTRGNSTNVIVLSIPDYAVTPLARYMDTTLIRKEIDLFNKINYSLTKKYNCSYVSITEMSREAKFNPAYICADSLHPSALEYKRWSRILASAIGDTF